MPTLTKGEPGSRTLAVVPLLLFLTASYAASFIGSQAAFQGLSGWYAGIAKPSWNPPGWLFGPVWTVLYGAMGFAAYYVWETPRSRRRTVALALWFVQLGFNALWSWLFFAWQRLDWAFFEIVILLLALVATTWLFGGLRRRAALLMAPYVLWVTFATVLSFTIWRLNP